MAKFTGTSWIEAGRAIEAEADELYAGAHGVTVAAPIEGGTSARLDPAIVAGDALFNAPWHRLVANVVEAMYIDASKMVSTGENYDAMEQEGTTAARRFWGAT